ncbi:hypothetical protein BEL04_05505 [Mucilaginibacter sp. PPCGB 2223]|uniref:hypothetical protein n=1 Tax=Mucilaginibacter sp. PPCGB 2223 TaxID=1886027 RepID=UPI0008240C21|nr:hypothetical protein [Mucilaginibacter sp. PPCGB 2223]OCX53745.1 hypothetical protein BEL04_05505 [Mucilaginibacter sp. PPCGB 2223]
MTGISAGLGKRIPDTSPFLSFVVSIYFGGKGINQARKDGFTSNWNITGTKQYFDWQAKTCFLGIIFFIINVFCGKQKADDLKINLSKETVLVSKLKQNDSLINVKVLKLENTVDSLKKKIATAYTVKRPCSNDIH